MRANALLSAVVVLLLGGCDEGEPKRVWKPSDHGQPPGSQVDPSRVPTGRSTGNERVDPEDVRARAAAALWRVSCARCHGPAGRGDGPEAPADTPDLTDPAWQEAKTDEDLAKVIRVGRGEMPPFGDQVSPAGLDALVTYVRGFNEAEAE